MGQEPLDITDRKKVLRARAVKSRDKIDPELRRRGAARLAEAADTLALLAGPSAGFSTYLAIGSEVDPEPLRRALGERGHKTALPVMRKPAQPLVFRQWQTGDALETRKWGIREPPDSAPPLSPDVLLLPLLAFDAAGWRLGYGGGYYDRTLSNLRARQSILAIGLAFDQQEVDAVPHSQYDERLDMILTPDGLRSLEPVDD